MSKVIQMKWSGEQEFSPLFLERQEAGLFSHFSRPENHRLLKSIAIAEKNPEAAMHLEKIMRRVIGRIQGGYGSFEDTAVGIENTFENLKKENLLIPKNLGSSIGISVAAGPSLDENLHHVKHLMERDYKVSAVDTAAKMLLAAGIAPKAVATTERFAVTSLLFEGAYEELKDTVLVIAPQANPALVKEWKGPVAMSPRKELWVQCLFGAEHSRMAGASCAPFQVGFLERTGVRKVYLVGQDLCLHPETMKNYSKNPHPDDGGPDWKYQRGHKEEELLSTGEWHAVEGTTYPKVMTSMHWDGFMDSMFHVVKDTDVECVNTSRFGRKLSFAPYDGEWFEKVTSQESLGGFAYNPFPFQVGSKVWKSRVAHFIREIAEIDTYQHTPKSLIQSTPAFRFLFDLILPKAMDYEAAIFNDDQECIQVAKDHFTVEVKRAQKFFIGVMEKHLSEI